MKNRLALLNWLNVRFSQSSYVDDVSSTSSTLYGVVLIAALNLPNDWLYMTTAERQYRPSALFIVEVFLHREVIQV